MTDSRLRYLMLKYADDACSPDELEELFAGIREMSEDSALYPVLLEEWQLQKPLAEDPHVDWKAMFELVVEAPTLRRRPLLRTTHWWAAAAVFLLMAVSTWLYIAHRPPAKTAAVMPPALEDLHPGGNKAMLTLADGTHLALDEASPGTIARQGGTRVTKTKNGSLRYQQEDAAGASQLSNTVTTPRGGQYQLELPDGTHVWLDAASSITYPVAFSGTSRMVSVTGQAYFEVASDPHKPFYVKAGLADIQVLGTAFNVNGYQDESQLTVTLLQGAVMVSKGSAQRKLSPGQAAIVPPGDGPVSVADKADTRQAVAWKDGLFQFDHADIRTVMRQLSRWYDVDIVYEGLVPADKFSGKLPRDASAAQVLGALEQTQVHFRIEGKKIIVLP